MPLLCVTGMVKIYKAYKTKDEKFLGGLNAKNFFGETAIVSTGRNVRRGASIIAATVLSLLRLNRTGLLEVMENEPKLLMHIRWVSNNRRRMNNEKLDAVGNVGLRATIVNEFASKLTKERRKTLIRQKSRDAVTKVMAAASPLSRLRKPNKITNTLKSMRNLGSMKVLPSRQPSNDAWEGGGGGGGGRSGVKRSPTRSNLVSQALSSKNLLAQGDGADGGGGGGGRIRVPPYLHKSGFSSEDNSSGEYTPRDHNGSLERSDSSISFGEPSMMGRVSSEDSSQNRSPSPHTVPLTRHERRENAAVAKEVTLRVAEWVREEVDKLLHERLDAKLAEVLAQAGEGGGGRA